MPHPAGFGTITGRVLLTGDTDEMNTTIGFEVSPIPFDQESANAVSLAMGTFLKACMSSSYVYLGSRITVGTATGDVIFESTTGVGNGSQGLQAVPQNTAFLFRKVTASGGRRNRGRMFVPGITEGSVDSAGVLLAADSTAYQNAATTFLNTMLTAGRRLHVLHPAQPAPPPKPAPPAIPFAPPTPIVALTLQPKAATQRRRLR